jgi:hypothetical protein
VRVGRAVVLLGERPVWWLGVGVLMFGLLLPWAILLWRASQLPGTDFGRGPLLLRPEMVALPAGTFVMGSPTGEEGHDDDEVSHEVLLTRPFLIART